MSDDNPKQDRFSSDTTSIAGGRQPRSQIGFSVGGDPPHRVREESPKNDRKEVSIHLGPEEQKHLRRLRQLAEDTFEERVYYTDVKLAAIIVGLEASDDAFLERMIDIGYNYFEE